MKLYVAVFWRGNPQLTRGGYKTVRSIEANTLRQARKQAEEIERDCVYGSMRLLDVRKVEYA